MDFEVQAQLSAIDRSVSFLDREGQPAAAITLSREFDTTLLDLWGAVTSASRIRSGPCRSPANSRWAASTSWRVTPAAPSRPAIISTTSVSLGSSVKTQVGSISDSPKRAATEPPLGDPHGNAVGLLGHLRPRRGRRRLEMAFLGLAL